MDQVVSGAPHTSSKEMTKDNWLQYHDLVAPNVDRNLHELYPKETLQLTGLFKETGRYKPTTNSSFDHYEMDRQYQLVLAEATVAAPAAGASMTITVSSAGHGLSGKTSQIRVKDIVMFADRTIGTVIAKDTAVDGAHTFTVSPNRVADTLPGVTAGDAIAIISRAEKEGSEAGDPQISRTPSLWRGYTQIITEEYKITRGAAATTGWIEVPKGSELAKRIGGSGWKWFMFEDKAAYDNLQKNIEFALLHGQETDNPAIMTAIGAGTGGLDASYTTTTGLLPGIGNHGLLPTYATPGTLALSDFQDLSDLLDENEGASEYLSFAGNAMLHKKDDVITDVFKQGAVTYGAFDNSGERAVRYGFDSFSLGGRSWHFKKYAPFYHPGLFGGLGAGFENDWFGIPYDMKRDAKTGNMIPSICIRYRANGGKDAHGITPNQPQTFSTDVDMAVVGGFPLPQSLRTGDQDWARIRYIAEQGLEVMGLNRFFHFVNP